MRGILLILMAFVLSLGPAFSQDGSAFDTETENGDSSTFAEKTTADAGSGQTEKSSKKKASSQNTATAAKSDDSANLDTTEKKSEKRPGSKKSKKSENENAIELASVDAEVDDEMFASGAGNDPDAQAAALARRTSAQVSSDMPFNDGVPQVSMLRTLGGMGLVLCLLAAAYFGVRRLAPGMFPKPGVGRNLKLIETLSMGDKRSISLVEVGGSRFLLGSTPGQVNLLATLPEHVSLVADEKPEETATESEDVRGGGNFRNLFEVEKKRPSQYVGSMPPEDIRIKMRRLREALEQ
ncbi:MAG: flagellar biosynthetic protein FliO [Acidobacteriota bacterium]|jgi:flagellar protein FliO/FliZ|nr:flagellar biosynthetic protein FliO [Acidobacteriota bacterium]